MDSKLIEMQQAIDRLNAAADAYYNGRGELMTDFEWDALFDRLRQLESETGVTLPLSPTQRVSADSVAGQKEAHEFPALSLAKTKQIAEVVKWARARPIWLSWKLDGLTLVITWDNGRLTKVVTRGDGHVGTNVTHLASGIAGIPGQIPEKGHLVVRGEAIISYADFEAFCMRSGEDYANPRNLASGSLTLKDAAELQDRGLRWIPFTLVSSPGTFASWGAQMDYLARQGLSCVQHTCIGNPTFEALQEEIAHWTKRVTSHENPYPVDGLVICYDDVEYAKSGSVTGHHATRAGYAFKWQDETAQTVLDHVEWSCAVSSIAPVAVFRPVELEGTTVRRASLCNVSECERLGIGGPGTLLTVIKANKIIPKVVSVSQCVGTFVIPPVCPVCGAPTQVSVSETLTRKLCCTNPDCAARALRKFMRFVAKDGMDIDGLAGETLAKFINCGWLKSFADIYRLPQHRAEIASLDGFGEKSANNICTAVQKATKRTAVNFLVALSIPLCGGDVARRLLSAYPLKALLEKAIHAAHPHDLFDGGREIFAAIDGIGPMKSAAFVDWCGEARNQALLADLLAILELEEPSLAPVGSRCANLVFVVTGDVHRFPNRSALKAYVEAQGGKVVGSVSAKTSFLVNNNFTSTSSKNLTAQKLGVPIISEDEFCRRFKDNEL